MTLSSGPSSSAGGPKGLRVEEPSDCEVAVDTSSRDLCSLASASMSSFKT